MVMADQLDSQNQYHTSFLNFYSGMLKTPYIGNKINLILPGSIFIFALIFSVLSWIGYES